MRFQMLQGAFNALLTGLIFIGCARTEVIETRSVVTPGVAKPGQVLVYNFAVTPDEVTENSAFFARLVRDFEQVTQTEEEIRIGHEVADVLAGELTAKIKAMGLNAVRGDPDTPIVPESILVKGQFIQINQGNRLKRVVIGFGLGKSSLDAKVVVLASENRGYEELLGFNAYSDSGDMPGATVMGPAGMAVGAGATAVAASNVALGAGKEYRSSSDEEARKMADAIAKKLSNYFAEQGWIQAEFVR